MNFPHIRPRRNRVSSALRDLIAETQLHVHDLVLPLFVVEGTGQKQPLPTLPNVYRLSIDELLKTAKEAFHLGILAVALFPKIDEKLKDSTGQLACDPDGLIPRAVRELKTHLPHLIVICDVALDPYSIDGHDGLLKNGKVLNDSTLEILAEMSCVMAQAGADLVAPSDMMDGRVRAIREQLDRNQFQNVGILAYAAKYCSSLYEPFREALQSTPREGNKKTYQMDYRNRLEAIREVFLDQDEGADIIMIKPAMFYLDIIREVRNATELPVAAYQVSGEYSMLKAATHTSGMVESELFKEALSSIKRAGANLIFSYYSLEMAKELGQFQR